MKSLAFAAALLMSAAPAALAQTTPPIATAQIAVPPLAYSQQVLANGVRVIAAPDPSAANVSVFVWYGVGQRDDPVGRGGFAHLFEHLMFKATRNLPDGAQAYMTSIGARGNASTLFDFTIYNTTGPADQLERLIWLEGERLRNLVIDQASFDSERHVVEEELRQRIFASPYGRILYTLIPGFVFSQHPYARPIGGSKDELDRAALAEVRAFHEAYYRPDNMVVVVTGNFDPQALETYVERHLGSISRPNRAMPRDTRDEPVRESARTVDAYAPNVPLPALVEAWRAPPAAHRDHAALMLIDALLTSGPASRLRASLVAEQKLAADIASYNLPARDGYGYTLVVTLAKGASLDDAQAALDAQLARLRDAPMPQAELDRVRNAILADALKARETSAGRANALGQSMILTGDPGADDRELAAIRALTPDDVRGAAATWLAADRVTRIRYRDESERPAGYAGDISPNRTDEMGTIVPPAEAPPVAIASQADRAAPPPAGPPVQRVVPRLADRRLPNGLRLIAAQSSSVPLTTIELAIPGGNAADPEGKAGRAAIAAGMTLRGASGRDAQAFAGALDALGASLTATTDPDATIFRLTVPSVNADAAGALLADAVLRPAMAADALENERRAQIAALEVQLKRPMGIGLRALNQAVFAGTPYGATPDAASLGAVSVEDARTARDRWSPREATLVITGSLDPAASERLARRLFSGWTGGPPRAVAPLPASTGPRIVAIDLPGAAQTAVLAGYRVPSRSAAGSAGIELASALAGGGSQAWLSQEIRQKRGLSYGAGTEAMMHARGGLLLGAAQTKNESALEVAELVLAQFARLGTEPVDAATIAERARFLAEGRAARTERTAGLADYLIEAALDGVPLARVRAELAGPVPVPEGQLAAAAALLAPENASLVLVGDASQWIDALRAKYPRVELIEPGK